MYEGKERIQKKVLHERMSSNSRVRTGNCPHCRALMSYRKEDVTRCICCGNLVEWSLMNSEK